MIELMERVPYKIEKNEGGTYAIIENPESEVHGVHAYAGDRVTRSPFDTPEEAQQRIKDIGEHFQYEPYEVK